MARKKRKKRGSIFSGNASPKTKKAVLGTACIILGIFVLLSFFDGAGVSGEFVQKFFLGVFGKGYYILPFILFLFSFSLFKETGEEKRVGLTHGIYSLIIFLAILGIIYATNQSTLNSGYAGLVLGYPFVKLLGVYAGIIFMGGLIIMSMFLLFDKVPDFSTIHKKLFSSFSMNIKKGDDFEEEEEDDSNALIVEEDEEEVEEEDVEDEEDVEEKEEEFKAKPVRVSRNYTPPPLSLLGDDEGKPRVGDIKANANIIQRTLANFGIQVEMDEITVGPTVTQYALKPAEGVKLSKIAALQNDLALALAAHPIRMELPIPGKSLVGIEIPNKSKTIVGLGSLLKGKEFLENPNPLTVGLGRSVSGKGAYMNLAKAPHALIAGTTGSGKSVMIHNLITSLLYKNGPEDLKMILVDPKRVELTLYKNIPHLLSPVITDAKKCVLALKWAAQEMEKRYDVLQQYSVRDISSYRKNIQEKNKGNDAIYQMPYIVIIIDELADIMQAYPRELESAIVRLAQMSRAVGIHLVLSTQRPEVNVITGLIKANVPTRLAFRVPTQVDSRTILDSAGAEKLLGSGDMLYFSGEGSPVRLQSPFVPEDQVKSVVSYIRDAFKDELPDEIEFSGSVSSEKTIFDSAGSDDDDDLYEEAREIVIDSQKASTSFLQRKLKIGYSRAARLMDILEERGVVGPADGSKPREVLEKSLSEERGEYE
ncbi:DNA translocase FtsK [Candidatus Nomurabacteria bacterium]|nr:DNA translocase FtsK [Candidatus Nomurabacteria bacterium]USN94583.1 MAG: DNA translocase FtsK [Candidatus Nomurabacteria bacterium]